MLTKKISKRPLWLIAVLIAFDGIGLPAQAAQSESAFKTVKRYSPAGLLLGTISPAPNASASEYPAIRYRYTDPVGVDGRTLLFVEERGYLTTWLNENTSPANWGGSFVVTRRTQFTYDQYGRKRTEGLTAAGGQYKTLTQYSYDSRSRVACKAVRMNEQLLSPASQPADNPGNVYSGGACVLGAEGNQGPDRVTKYVYDDRDNVLEEHRAVGTDLEQVYMKNTWSGYLRTSVTDANSNRAEMQYDEWSRLKKWIFPHKDYPLTANQADYEEYRYDLNGNRTYFRKRDGSVFNYQYDALNRVIKKDVPVKPANHPFEEDVFYGYDTRGLQLHAMYGDYASASHTNIGVTTAYSGFGEIISEANNVGGAYTVRHGYDIHGNRQSTTYHDNSVFQREYDHQDRLTGIRKGAGHIANFGYRPDGRPNSKTTHGGATATEIDYDSVSRVDLISLNLADTNNDLDLGFAYNPASQLDEKTVSNAQYHHQGGFGNLGSYAVNNLNQYTSVNGTSYQWDANGNLIQDEQASYSYDKENRLVKVSKTGGAIADLIYDPAGRLVQYKVGGASTDFVYDGDVIIAEYRNNGTHADYVHVNSIGTPLASYEYQGSTLMQTRYLHLNHQGSVIALSDAGGQLAQINTYDAYGVSGVANLGRFGYTGQVWLKEVGLYHYRARAYRAEIGRFLQTDPIGYEDQINLYAYVHNDPLNFIDPTGEEGWATFGAFAAMIHESGMAGLAVGAAFGTGVLIGMGINKGIEVSTGSSLGGLIYDGHQELNEKLDEIVNEAIDRRDRPFLNAAKAAAAESETSSQENNQKLISKDNKTESVGDVHSSGYGFVEGGVAAETIESITDSSRSEKARNSDRGMSGGNVRICSGMGAEKGRCN